MANFIVVCILVIILGSAIRFIYKSKKKGVKCIGCPSGSTCGKSNGCHCKTE